MKKILLTMALALSVVAAGAQPKTAADAQKAVNKAIAATQDAKKAVKAATWIALADAYEGAYDQPTRNLLSGTPQMEVKLFLKEQQVLGSEEVNGSEGSKYTVDKYSDKNLYYNEGGVLEFWKVTKPAIENCDMLSEAKNALIKAMEVEPSYKKVDDVKAKLESIHNKIHNEALAEYLLGNFKDAASLFEKSLSCYDNPVMSKVDSMNHYYTAFVSALGGDKEKAKKYYNKCADMGFYQEGNVFSNLAEIYRTDGDMDNCKATLEKGFAAYPQSQGILVGLINLYRESGEDTQKLFDLLHKAQENEPNNASLYYVEGDIYKKLGDVENAAKLYTKSSEIDPNYVFGTLGVGILYYEKAVDIQNAAAEEFDDNKYMALVKQFEETLEKAIEPFEAAYTKTNDPDIQQAIAEYLKNIYFRFRDKSPEYQAAYEKYNSLFNK